MACQGLFCHLVRGLLVVSDGTLEMSLSALISGYMLIPIGDFITWLLLSLYACHISVGFYLSQAEEGSRLLVLVFHFHVERVLMLIIYHMH